MPASDPPLPFDGHVYFGCRTWEPRFDLDYGRQDAEGLWRIGRARKGSRCQCGGKDGFVRHGYRLYCAGCNAYSQDHRLPNVPPVRSYAPPAPAVAVPEKLTRKEKRRRKLEAVGAVEVAAPVKGTIEYSLDAPYRDYTRRSRGRKS